MFLKVIKEGELIVKIPRSLMPDLEIHSKKAGYKNSRELLANFVRKQLALYYKCEVDNYKLTDIH